MFHEKQSRLYLVTPQSYDSWLIFGQNMVDCFWIIISLGILQKKSGWWCSQVCPSAPNQSAHPTGALNQNLSRFCVSALIFFFFKFGHSEIYLFECSFVPEVQFWLFAVYLGLSLFLSVLSNKHKSFNTEHQHLIPSNRTKGILHFVTGRKFLQWSLVKSNKSSFYNWLPKNEIKNEKKGNASFVGFVSRLLSLKTFVVGNFYEPYSTCFLLKFLGK